MHVAVCRHTHTHTHSVCCLYFSECQFIRFSGAAGDSARFSYYTKRSRAVSVTSVTSLIRVVLERNLF